MLAACVPGGIPEPTRFIMTTCRGAALAGFGEPCCIFITNKENDTRMFTCFERDFIITLPGNDTVTWRELFPLNAFLFVVVPAPFAGRSRCFKLMLCRGTATAGWLTYVLPVLACYYCYSYLPYLRFESLIVVSVDAYAWRRLATKSSCFWYIGGGAIRSAPTSLSPSCLRPLPTPPPDLPVPPPPDATTLPVAPPPERLLVLPPPEPPLRALADSSRRRKAMAYG